MELSSAVTPKSDVTAETRKAARCPVARPAEIFDPLKEVIADKPESLMSQFKELARLQENDFDLGAAEWLR